MRIRDFIYLDADRLKSIIAQIEKGVVETSAQVTSRSTEAKASGHAGLLGIAKVTGGTGFLWQRQESETRTLHDYIYIKVEESLLESKKIVVIPGDISLDSVTEGNHVEKFQETPFVLATGRIAIDDFRNMRQFMERFNEFAQFVAYVSTQDSDTDTTTPLTKREKRRQAAALKLDKRLLDGFKLTFDLFYSNRISIRLTPFADNPDFRLVGDLDERFLRDRLASITYKYGSSPVSDWTVFAQVAAVPPQVPPELLKPTTGGVMNLALQAVFDSYRQLEGMSQTVTYPEISITPIAMYRAWGSGDR